MTIKQQGGIFGRNPEFNEVDANTGSFTDLTATNLTTTKDGAVSATFNRLTSKGDMLLFEYNGSRIGSLGLEASGLYLDGEDSHMGIKFVSSQLFPRDNGVDTNGSNDLGGTNNRWRNLYLDNNVIVSSGGGIDFSATSGTGTSELFSDYEEGLWSPTVDSGTCYVSYGSYIKIGKMVHATFKISDLSDTTTASAINVSLPFTAGSFSSSQWFGSWIIRRYDVSTSVSGAMRVLGGGTTMDFRYSDSTVGSEQRSVNYDDNTSGTNDYLAGSITYFAAS